MSATKDFRKESRSNWVTTQETVLTEEQINLGCMLRIADAVELMAKDRVQTEAKLKRQDESIEYLTKQRNDAYDEIKRHKASKSAYKSQAKKLRVENAKLREQLNAIQEGAVGNEKANA